MDYIELNITVTPREPFTEILISGLAELGFESFVETETGFQAYIQEALYAVDMERTSWAWHLPDVAIDYVVRKIPRVNWNEAWEKNFEPILVDDQVYIHAPFHPAKPELPHNLLIEPKMSFGTGHHQTTHMMVHYLLEVDCAEKTVLDMGCGTGVLAILALQRGAGAAWAIDIDEWAVANTIENAARNGVTLTAVQGGVEAIPNVPFDLILANINKNVLLADMAAYAAALQAGGTIVFSGFYTQDLADITAAAAPHGLHIVNSKVRDTWQAARFVKTGG